MFALVTGAGGLLGRHLTAELLRRSHRVRALDVKSANDLPKDVESVRGDIRNSETARSACVGVDVVFHLAALLPQSKSTEDALRSVNVKGTESLLSAAVAESVRRFVYSSSVEVYGLPDQIPCSEDAPKKTLGPYSRTKVECEELCARYSADFGIETVTMRMPLIVGPGFHHEKFFLQMFDRIGRGKAVLLIGGGRNRYQMVASSDVVDAYLLAAKVPAAAGEAFNIASDPAKVISAREMIERVIRKVGSKSKVRNINATLAQVAIKVASAIGKPILLKDYHEVAFADYVFEIKKARQLLGYEPKKDDAEAMAETVQWYLKR